MTLEQRLDLTTQYEGALKFVIAIKQRLIECDAPNYDVLFKIFDKELDKLYGDIYGSEITLESAKELLK